jgi:hypothetical protein
MPAHPKGTTMRTERRTVARERVFHQTSAVFNGGQSVFQCSLRNRSATGAMVRLSDWTELPATFELNVPGQELRLRVRQCWRRGDDVGVAFLSEDECRPPAPIDLAAVRALRALNSANSPPAR